ncbi:hypothetical protein TNCV_303841 [Trichonephila clavipes]|nr:hypothetical protein TNCV_303841 [Trichonephila clavipes]
MVAVSFLSEVSRRIRECPSVRRSVKCDSSKNATCCYSLDTGTGGTGVQIPAFVADEQPAQVYEQGVCFGGPNAATFNEV